MHQRGSIGQASGWSTSTCGLLAFCAPCGVYEGCERYVVVVVVVIGRARRVESIET